MYNTSNLNSMKRIVYMLAVLFYGTSLFAQDKPFDIEHAPLLCSVVLSMTALPTRRSNGTRSGRNGGCSTRNAVPMSLTCRKWPVYMAVKSGSRQPRTTVKTGIMSGLRTCRNPCKDRALSGLPMCSSIRTLIT